MPLRSTLSTKLETLNMAGLNRAQHRNKVLLNTAFSICLLTICGCFLIKKAVLSRCDSDHMTCKA